ncbi:MAG: ribosome maturation factor RimM [Methylococcaceae bacterium]
MSTQRYINVGKVSGAFGIKGWVKVFSFTDPLDNILSYSPWLLKKNDQTIAVELIDGGFQGKAIIASLKGIDNRDLAEALLGYEIMIRPEQLPKTEEGEYYWSDLIGLHVETTLGVDLGVVDSLLATGANDVLIVQGDKERAVPFLQGQTVLQVDLVMGKIIVDWDPEF